MAALIHRASRPGQGPIVDQLAAITDSLLESELFGHERGSFTGAYPRPRRPARARASGDRFLDEIGEMTLRTRHQLLRFLETGEIQRVGSVRVGARVDVRARGDEPEFDRTDRSEDVPRGSLLSVERLSDRDSAAAGAAGGHPGALAYFQRIFGRQQSVNADPSPGDDAGSSPASLAWGTLRELKNLVERLIVRCGNAVDHTGRSAQRDLRRGRARRRLRRPPGRAWRTRFTRR